MSTLAENYTKQKTLNFKQKKEIDKLKKQHNEDMDIIAAQTQELQSNEKIIEDLRARYEKKAYNVVINNGNVTEIHILPEYRTYLPYIELDGYDMSKLMQFMKTPLYQNNEALQFMYEENRQLRVDETKYKKFLGGLV